MRYNLPDRVFRELTTLAQKYSVTKIILFGSRARGTHTERSDIDIVVLGCQRKYIFTLNIRYYTSRRTNFRYTKRRNKKRWYHHLRKQTKITHNINFSESVKSTPSRPPRRRTLYPSYHHSSRRKHRRGVCRGDCEVPLAIIFGFSSHIFPLLKRNTSPL